MKVAVGMPAYRCGRFFDTVAASLYRLDPQPDLYLFAENNSPDNTLQKLKRFHRPKEVISFHLNPNEVKSYPGRYDIIGLVRQKILTRVRELGIECLLFLDSDLLVITWDLINVLMAHEGDIIGGSYLRLFPQGVFTAALWPGDPFTLLSWPRLPFERVRAVGGGCMMLKSTILQDRRLNFFPVREASSEDYGFCLDAEEFGYTCWLDGTVQLRHWLSPAHVDGKRWKVDPETLKPLPFSYAG
jgi:glycosyltransferase involved in cell wall biosynthesis